MTLKDNILKLRLDGKSYKEIQQELGCSKGTISYYCNINGRQSNVDRTTQLRRRNKEYAWSIKAKHGCVKCGNKDPECLDFHHIDHSTKTNTIAQLIRNATTINNLQNEIDKCEILCSNCHQEQHFNPHKTYRKNKNIQHITKFKLNSKCEHCGHSGISTLVFHHLEDKSFNISQDRDLRTVEETIEEIKKCIVLCGNCHRKLHHKQDMG
jgi:DNA-binding CsgD family transcriptional regulator